MIVIVLSLVALSVKGAPLQVFEYTGPKEEAYLQETRAGEFEGDIVLPKSDGFRNIIKHESNKWPGGVIPYEISDVYSDENKQMMVEAMRKIENNAAVNGRPCLKFVPRTKEVHYIYIYRGAGCSSPVGRNGGKQSVSLGWGCGQTGIIQHELLHSLGFWHEQSRPDRDRYVDIFLDNVYPGQRFNFDLHSNTQTFNTPYDYNSLMHYGSKDFSHNGKHTILPKPDSSIFIGQRDGMSRFDTYKLQQLYQCSNPQTNPVVPQLPPGVYLDCDLEKGWCNDIIPETNAPLQVERHRADGRFGPNTDHTTGTSNGYYMSSLGSSNSADYARLNVYMSQKAEGYCLSVWFYGQSDATLRLWIAKLDQVKDNSGKGQWVNVRHHVDASGSDITLSMEFLGSKKIALDDIKLTSGQC